MEDEFHSKCSEGRLGGRPPGINALVLILIFGMTGTVIFAIAEQRNAVREQEIVFQGEYVQELINATDYPSFDIDGVNKTFFQWEHHKEEDIMTFRNHSYRSLMTGKMSPTAVEDEPNRPPVAMSACESKTVSSGTAAS